MSHVVEIQTEVRDEAAVQAACSRLELPRPTRGTFQLHNASVTGLGIQLPRWKYPVVADIDGGTLQYDNFDGRWGQPQELGRFLQMYAVEKTRLEARRKGHWVTEQRLGNGSIKLTVNLGVNAGGAP